MFWQLSECKPHLLTNSTLANQFGLWEKQVQRKGKKKTTNDHADIYIDLIDYVLLVLSIYESKTMGEHESDGL